MATELKVTVKEGGGGDYTSLEAALDDNEQDLTSTNKYLLIEIDGAWTSDDTTKADIANYTTGINNYIHIYTTAAARHSGKWDDTKYRIVYSNGSAIEIGSGAGYITIEGIQIESQGNGTHCVKNSVGTATSDILIDKMVMCLNTSGSSYNSGVGETGDATCEVRNTIIYQISEQDNLHGIFMGYSNSVYNANNVTVIGMEDGFERDGGTFNCANCATVGCYDGYDGVSSQTNCLSDINGDANIYTTQSDTDLFVDPSNYDFHVKDTNSDLYGAGTDLSGTFTDDIDGETRDQWDIGADEYVVPAEAHPQIVMISE